MVALVDAGQGVDRSIILGDQFLDLGIIFHQRGEVRHVLFNQVVEQGSDNPGLHTVLPVLLSYYKQMIQDLAPETESDDTPRKIYGLHKRALRRLFLKRHFCRRGLFHVLFLFQYLL